MLTHGMRALVALGVGAFLVAGPHASSLPEGSQLGGTAVTVIDTGFGAGIGLVAAGLGLLSVRRFRERLAGLALLVGLAGLAVAVPGESPRTGTGLAPLLFLAPAVASAILATAPELRTLTRAALAIGCGAGIMLAIAVGPLAGNGLPDSLPLAALLFLTGAGLLTAVVDEALGSTGTEAQPSPAVLGATA